MSMTGDALRLAASNVASVLDHAEVLCGAEGQPAEITDAIGALMSTESGGGGATGVVAACNALATKADAATLNPPAPSGDGN